MLRSFLVILLALFMTSTATANTKRIAQLSNQKVAVWETIIYPGSGQVLKMHNHAHDRVVVALTDGMLKVVSKQGKVHYLRFAKDHAYYLAKDQPRDMHTDENISHHAIKVMVVELKNT